MYTKLTMLLLCALGIIPPASAPQPATGPASQPAPPQPVIYNVPIAPDNTFALRVLERARQEVRQKVIYCGNYFSLPYPAGDVPAGLGACTDLVIRAYRNAGIDLQKEVHEDELHYPDEYPPNPIGEKAMNPDIDHRRCRHLLVWFRHHAQELPAGFDPQALASYEPGDVIFINFEQRNDSYPDHIGIISDHRTPEGIPTVYDNLGPVAAEHRLDAFCVIQSHFRWPKTDAGKPIAPRYAEAGQTERKHLAQAKAEGPTG